MAYNKNNNKNEQKQYNTKVKVTTLEWTRDGERKTNRLPYLSIIDAFAMPRESKNGKKYFRIPINGEYSIERVAATYEAVNSLGKYNEHGLWITAFLPSEKCFVPDDKMCRISACGTLRFDPDSGYTMSIDYYTCGAVE